MDIPKPESEMGNEHLSNVEAKEWALLQSAICEKLTTDHITSANQLDPGLIEQTRVHLVICEVIDHQPIDGIYVDIE